MAAKSDPIPLGYTKGLKARKREIFVRGTVVTLTGDLQEDLKTIGAAYAENIRIGIAEYLESIGNPSARISSRQYHIDSEYLDLDILYEETDAEFRSRVKREEATKKKDLANLDALARKLGVKIVKEQEA